MDGRRGGERRERRRGGGEGKIKVVRKKIEYL